MSPAVPAPYSPSNGAVSTEPSSTTDYPCLVKEEKYISTVAVSVSSPNGYPSCVRRRNSADAISLVSQNAVSLHLPSRPSRRRVPGVPWEPSNLRCEPVEKPFDFTRAGTALEKLISKYESCCQGVDPNRISSFPLPFSEQSSFTFDDNKEKIVLQLASTIRGFVEQSLSDTIPFASGGLVDLLSMGISAMLPHSLVMVFLRDPETDELVTSIPSGCTYDASWENVVHLAIKKSNSENKGVSKSDGLLTPTSARKAVLPTMAHLRCSSVTGFMGNLFERLHLSDGRVEVEQFPFAKVAVDWLAENEGCSLSYIRRASQADNVSNNPRKYWQTPLSEAMTTKSREYLDNLGFYRDDSLIMEEALMHILNVNLESSQNRLIHEMSTNSLAGFGRSLVRGNMLWPSVLPPLSSVPAVLSLARLDGIPTRSATQGLGCTRAHVTDDSTEVGSSSRSGSPRATKERARKGLTRLSPVSLLRFRSPKADDTESLYSTGDDNPVAGMRSVFGRRQTCGGLSSVGKRALEQAEQITRHTLSRSANLLPQSPTIPVIAAPMMGSAPIELLPRQRMLDCSHLSNGMPLGMILVFPFALMCRGVGNNKDLIADKVFRKALTRLLIGICTQVQPLIYRNLHVALTMRDLRMSNLMLLFHRYVCKDLSNSENVIKRLLALAEEATLTEISALFVVDHLSSEFICHLGPSNCLGLRLGFTHPVLSPAFRSQRPVSFGLPLDVPSLNAAFDKRSGIPSSLVLAVPLSTPDGDVKAILVLINRKGRGGINRRATSDYPMDTSRSTNSSTTATLMRLQTNRTPVGFEQSPRVPRQLSMDCGTSFSGRGVFLDGVEISDDYFSRYEELIMEAVANEFSNMCYSALTRVTIRAILNTQQSRHAILHYMMPLEDASDSSPAVKLPRTPRRGSIAVTSLLEAHQAAAALQNSIAAKIPYSSHNVTPRFFGGLDGGTSKTIEPIVTPRLKPPTVSSRSSIASIEQSPKYQEGDDDTSAESEDKNILLSRMLSHHISETICSNTFRCPLSDTPWSRFGIKWWDHKLPELELFWLEAVCSLGVEELFFVERETLSRFFYAIADTYRVENPFHNFYHALQCFHATWMLLGIHDFSRFLYSIESFAVLVSAISHDADHPGLNNAFVINASHPIAVTYNDKSVLEMHHCATVFRMMLAKPETDIRRTLNVENAKVFRRSFIVGVLGTDMQHHSKRLSLFADRVQKHSLEIDPFSCENDSDREFIIEMTVHAADLSNPMMPNPFFKLWSALAIEEFNRQCDLETKFGMEVTGFMNVRTEKSRTEMQLGFLEFVALPTWRTLTKLEPSLAVVIIQGEENSAYWRNRLLELDCADRLKDLDLIISNFHFCLKDFYDFTDHRKRPRDNGVASWGEPDISG